MLLSGVIQTSHFKGVRTVFDSKATSDDSRRSVTTGQEICSCRVARFDMLSSPIVHLQGVSSMKKHLFVAAALIAFASSGIAQDKHTQVTPDAVIWKDNAAFPTGVQVATLVGD
jgi:hypothetical protein